MTPENETTLSAVAVQVTDKAVNFLGEIIGEPLKDLAGIIYADRLKIIRQENLANTAAKYHERGERRGLKEVQAVSLALAKPILEGAAEESREEIQELWAKLLLAATDPNRSRRVSYFHIETVKKLDPIDAFMMEAVNSHAASDFGAEAKVRIAANHQFSVTTLEASLTHLAELGLIKSLQRQSNDDIGQGFLTFTARGAELMSLLSD